MFSRQLFLAVAAFWLAASPASAILSGPALDHGRSAFEFAARKEWPNALQEARLANNKALEKLIEWQSLLDPESGAGFLDISEFIMANPNWPDIKKLRVRAEMALREVAVSDDTVLLWFADEPPVTGYGKLALADALSRQTPMPKEKVDTLVREAWIGGDFDESQEKELREKYGSLLGKDEHIARADRLLWEEKTHPAKRMLPLVPASYRTLYEARIALINDKKTAALYVGKVDGKLRKDPGLTYDRMRYRARRDDASGVREMLLAAPAEVPFPEKWWRHRESQVRKAIGEGNYKAAQKLLKHHGQTEGVNQADAIWLSGWLELEFLKQPKKAYDIFYRMYDSVRYAQSRSRAAYWTARAAEKSGDKETASNWYNTAAAYPMTFYGQLASTILNGAAPLHIPAQPKINDAARQKFESSDIAQAVQICIELDNMPLANKLISFLVENASDKEQAALAAELGVRDGYPYLGVRGAKKALQNNMVLIDTGYPTPSTPVDIPIERPLALAIIRQESEFDPGAKSPANALGYMQLLPSTAKEMAGKLEMGWSVGSLYDTEYNMTLGSYYLSRLINSYNGSYVMAIAAYNAGGGNVRNWVKDFGTPGNSVDGAVNWIETIPFAETRNYVQRVLENLQVYRHIESDGKTPKLLLDEDLIR